MTYITKQQQAVLQCLERQPRAVSAAQLAQALRADGCTVGLATVYRQLDKLEQQGRVHRVNTEEGAVYQYCSHEGHHNCFLLKCRDCGSIQHMDCHRLQDFCRHVEDDHRFFIDPRSIVFAGLCGACAARGKEAT